MGVADIPTPDVVQTALHDAYFQSAKHGLNELIAPNVAKDFRGPLVSTTLLAQSSDHASEYAKTRAGDLVNGVADTTREKIKEIVSDATKNNWSVDQVAAELQRRGHFGKELAEMIARTEISAAQNAGLARAGADFEEGTGQPVSMVWMVDGDPCPICEEHDGEVVAIGGLFDGGDFPPMPPNCMCEIELLVDEVESDFLEE